MKRVLKAIENHITKVYPNKTIGLIRHEGYQYYTVMFDNYETIKVEIEYDAKDQKVIYVKIEGQEKVAYRP